ncbi:hypothetical protein JTB14_002425 [Gonioctena quinquepunctata]|nr:hypothetical protein JTB14_002425 [Gonioctena quinquepunctata]
MTQDSGGKDPPDKDNINTSPVINQVAKMIYNLKIGELKKLKRKGRNRMSVEFKTFSAANSFLNSEIIKSKGLECFIPGNNITCKGIIRYMDEDVTEKEIIDNTNTKLVNCKSKSIACQLSNVTNASSMVTPKNNAVANQYVRIVQKFMIQQSSAPTQPNAVTAKVENINLQKTKQDNEIRKRRADSPPGYDIRAHNECLYSYPKSPGNDNTPIYDSPRYQPGPSRNPHLPRQSHSSKNPIIEIQSHLNDNPTIEMPDSFNILLEYLTNMNQQDKEKYITILINTLANKDAESMEEY